MYRSRPGGEAGKDERMSYECKIKQRDRILLARYSVSLFYFIGMQTTPRKCGAFSKVIVCMALIASLLVADCFFDFWHVSQTNTEEVRSTFEGERSCWIKCT